MNVSDKTNNNTLGIYRSTNQGTNWNRIFNDNIHWGQGWYNTICIINPVNPNHVIVGGGDYKISTNMGNSWSSPSVFIHPDHHAFAWNPSGDFGVLGNDGGLLHTFDGSTYYDNYNYFPITQFYNIDNKYQNYFLFGGTQDNGVIGSYGLDLWIQRLGGDGFGVAIDELNGSNVYAVMNYNIYRTTNGGSNWVDISTTIGPVINVLIDKNNSTNIYTHFEKIVLKSTNSGTNWDTIT